MFREAPSVSRPFSLRVLSDDIDLVRRKTEYITNPPPTVNKEPPSFELSYGNPRRRASAHATVPEPLLSKSGESIVDIWKYRG